MSNIEEEVKSLIQTGTWNALSNNGIKLSDYLMEKVSEEVYTLIWEYIKDYD